MTDTRFKEFAAGGLSGLISSKWDSPDILGVIANLGSLVHSEGARVLAGGRNRVVCIEAARGDWYGRMAVKAFGKRSFLMDNVDAGRGSRARRTFDIAMEMLRRGVQTPEPVCFAERWQGKHLVESYYVSVMEEGHVSFKDELIRLFKTDPECSLFMDLMETVAGAVAKMHKAGVMHRDLGNQNILLRRINDGWGDVKFMDLNRSQILDELNLRQRARDISRIYLPSDLMRIFIEMYFGGSVPPAQFLRAQKSFRERFRWHTRTRPLRHPLRALNKVISGREDDPGYPLERDMWIWDSRSAQPISVMRPRDRRRWYPISRHTKVLSSALRIYRSVKQEYAGLLFSSYSQKVDMAGRFGLALGLDSGNDEREIELLQEIGDIPVLVRVQPHKQNEMPRVASVVRRLSAAGREVTLSLLQDRRSVARPGEWDDFVKGAAGLFGEHVTSVEVGHAINRVKWGLWDIRDYANMAFAAQRSFGGERVKLMGPAVIDFEYQYVAAALESLPEGFKFDALSHHLYVDRRGAPEKGQSGYSTLEKAALLRAIARSSPAVNDRVVVSEVNWPILGTGVWSPVNSPYESPGERFNDPSVNEDDYAAYMVRYLLICICSGMVDRVFWWRLVARGFGLVDDSDESAWRKRPAYLMFKQLVKMMDGATFTGREEPAEGAGLLAFSRTGGTKFAVGLTGGQNVAIPLPFKCSRIFDAYGKDIEASGQITLGGTPIYFRSAEA